MPIPKGAVDDAAAYAANWFDYRIQALQVPGAVMAIQHDDRLVVSHAAGLADLEEKVAMRPDHRFRIASHSKTFTATALMTLVERGRVRLDDRLDVWLPWLAEAADARMGRATLRDVLSHTAGIIRDGVDVPWWALTGPFHDAASLRDAVTETPAVIDRMTRFKYSNIGYSLLGLVIEAVTGEPYAEVVRREIVDRLGLSNTEPEPSETSAFATPYSSKKHGLARRRLPSLDTRGMAAATGFSSTAADLCRYGRAHFLGNEELLSDESKRQLHHEHWRVEGGRRGHYALGFHVFTIGDRRVISHGGGFPGYITFTIIDPVDRLVVTVLTNAIDGPAEALATGIVRLIGLAESCDPATSAGEGDLHRYAGRFLGLWSTTDIVRFGDSLFAIDPDLPDPVVDVTRLEVADRDALRIADTAGFGSYGESVTFDRNERDEVAAVHFAGGRLLPYDAYVAELDDRCAGRMLSPGS
ncbi:MAG TPA: serine hydrolase domain-containing protein [Acidimicrobiales bacterium]|jgi:D-alanyl-D-alanine carboxypeptidase|nr:serine hydrolase domain-containing protein [Acidimicrobiales bacterium]